MGLLALSHITGLGKGRGGEGRGGGCEIEIDEIMNGGGRWAGDGGYQHAWSFVGHEKGKGKGN